MYQNYRSVTTYPLVPSNKPDQVYQYSINIEPNTTSIMKRTLIKEMQTKYNDIVFGNTVPIFDGKSTIISAQLLPFDCRISLSVKNPFPNNPHTGMYVDTFMVRLSLIKEKDISQIRSGFHLKSKNEYSIQELLSLRHLSKSENEEFAQKLSFYYELLRDKSYDQIRSPVQFNPTVPVPLGGGEGKFVFLKDYILDYLDLKDIKQLNKGLTLMERRLLNIHLKGEKFRVPHQLNYGYYSFSGITLESCSKSKFQIDGEDILVKDYFLLKYNYFIKLEFLPCIISEHGNLFPMELCEIFVLNHLPMIKRKVDTDQLKRSRSLNRSKSFNNQNQTYGNVKEKVLKNLNLKLDTSKFLKGEVNQFWSIFPILDNDIISKITTGKFVNQFIRSYTNFDTKFRLEGKFIQTQNLNLDPNCLKETILKNYLIGCNNFKGYPTLLIFLYSSTTKHLIKETQILVDSYVGVPTLFVPLSNTINPTIDYLVGLCKTLENRIKPMTVKEQPLEYPRLNHGLIIGAQFTQDKIGITSSRLSAFNELKFETHPDGSNLVQLISKLLDQYPFTKHILLYRNHDISKNEDEYINEAVDISDDIKDRKVILTYIVIDMKHGTSNNFRLYNEYGGKHKYDIIFDDSSLDLDYYARATQSFSKLCLDSALILQSYYSNLFCHHKELLSYVDNLSIEK